MSDLEKICDYVTYIRRGRVVFSESKDDILEKYGILKCSRADFEAVDRTAVIASRETEFNVEALVEKKRVNPALAVDDAEIEDIMIYFSRED